MRLTTSNKSSRRFIIVAVVAVLAFASAVSGSQSATQDEALTIRGIWAHGESVLLLADVRQCEEDRPFRPMQTLVSKDGGRTWAVSGPRLVGRSLALMLDSGEELWFAGDHYDAEGPASDPFVMLYDADRAQWKEFEIYSGYEELEALARDERNGNRFLAWVRHIDFSAGEQGSPDLFLHQSLDRGRTWSIVKQVKHVPAAAAGLRFFEEFPQRSGRWRISRMGLASAAIEHFEDHGKWQEVARLPLPIQQTCSQ